MIKKMETSRREKDIRDAKILFRYFISFMKLEKSNIPQSVLLDIILLIENVLGIFTNYDLGENDAMNELEKEGWIEYGINGSKTNPVMFFGKELRDSAEATRELIFNDFKVDAYFEQSKGIQMLRLQLEDRNIVIKMYTFALIIYLYYKFVNEDTKSGEKYIEYIENYLKGEYKNECNKDTNVTDISNDSLHDILR